MLQFLRERVCASTKVSLHLLPITLPVSVEHFQTGTRAFVNCIKKTSERLRRVLNVGVSSPHTDKTSKHQSGRKPVFMRFFFYQRTTEELSQIAYLVHRPMQIKI